MPNPNKDKDARLERHSAGGPSTHAYGAGEKKGGGGKANWGKEEEAERDPAPPAIDPKDPNYDSGSEENKETANK